MISKDEYVLSFRHNIIMPVTRSAPKSLTKFSSLATSSPSLAATRRKAPKVPKVPKLGPKASEDPELQGLGRVAARRFNYDRIRNFLASRIRKPRASDPDLPSCITVKAHRLVMSTAAGSFGQWYQYVRCLFHIFVPFPHIRPVFGLQLFTLPHAAHCTR